MQCFTAELEVMLAKDKPAFLKQADIKCYFKDV